jgi:glutamate/tyrosine decarboxylase-like PLP-dependent enzyme
VSALSAFLFANPSFVNGTAHLLDFWGTYDTYNHSRTREEADAIALYADWRSVGEELLQALNQATAHSREQTL